MADTHYRVLARKYRPQNFDDLVGQDVLVRTLTNAFSSGRIAHAFLLTGIRGIGKTTTARIIARGLNCLGADGNGGPTTSPCGVCPNCKMILEDRHVDVIEMDAASRTGVDDIRDIIDTVHYAPTSARYKIYIIDEVHMLSKNAFNALLKTLEEPPAHVKFIFATTELRKIPVTIISRCQRFDLRRLDIEQLAHHLSTICQKESVEADEESLKLIATAAEGSVRDALSLLDQGIALSADAQGNASIVAEATREMLGMANKSHTFNLLEHAINGETTQAIMKLRELYGRGIDPVHVLHDMLELVHFITRVSLSADLVGNVQYSDIEQQRAKELATSTDMAALTRFWQMILKGIQEVKLAPQPMAAAEMMLVRIGYASTLPSPEDLIRKLEKGDATASASTPGAARPSGSAGAGATSLSLAAHAVAQPVTTPTPASDAAPLAKVHNFEETVALFKENKEPLLYSQLVNDVRFVRLQQGRLELNPISHLPADFAPRIGRHLTDWTGTKWLVTFSEEDGQPSLREQALKAQEQRKAYAASHPSVQAVIDVFPGAQLMDVLSEDDNA